MQSFGTILAMVTSRTKQQHTLVKTRNWSSGTVNITFLSKINEGVKKMCTMPNTPLQGCLPVDRRTTLCIHKTSKVGEAHLKMKMTLKMKNRI